MLFAVDGRLKYGTSAPPLPLIANTRRAVRSLQKR